MFIRGCDDTCIYQISNPKSKGRKLQLNYDVFWKIARYAENIEAYWNYEADDLRLSHDTKTILGEPVVFNEDGSFSIQTIELIRSKVQYKNELCMEKVIFSTAKLEFSSLIVCMVCSVVNDNFRYDFETYDNGSFIMKGDTVSQYSYDIGGKIATCFPENIVVGSDIYKLKSGINSSRLFDAFLTCDENLDVIIMYIFDYLFEETECPFHFTDNNPYWEKVSKEERRRFLLGR